MRRAYKKKILEFARGFYGRQKNCWTVAGECQACRSARRGGIRSVCSAATAAVTAELVSAGFTAHLHHTELTICSPFPASPHLSLPSAVRAVHRAWQKAYIGRKLKKRVFRADWIQKINAASRQFGMPYNQLVRFLPAAGVDLNRKVLSDLAVAEPYAFRALVEAARTQRDAELAARGQPPLRMRAEQQLR